MDDPLVFLQKTVATPSYSGYEMHVAEYLVEQMADFCDEAFVDDSGSAVGRWGNGPLKVYFLGHIDTVEGYIPVRFDGDKLYGRGSVDAKGSFCTAVVAASNLSQDLRKAMTLMLIGATEEESPTSKGARHALKTYPKPDLVIIGEPSNWDAMTLGYKGRLVGKLELQKDNFHSAGEGTTAAEDLVDIWNKLKARAESYNQDQTGIFDTLQISLQHFAGASDGLYQKAVATIGYRLPPALTPAQVKQLVLEHSSPAKLHIAGEEIAYRSEKDTPLTRAFRVAMREHKAKPRFKVKTGTSDMNVVAPIWNVPMLAYGPGDSALDHTPGEYLDLTEYKKAVAVLTTALEYLAKTYTPERS